MDQKPIIDQKLLSRFYELKQAKKEIDHEINQIRREILTYFDKTKGENINSEIQIGDYVVQRNVRKKEKYNNELMVKRLKELGLEECIQVVEQPDEEKVESALSLNFIKKEDLEGCIKYKYTPYLSIEKYS